MRFRAGVVLIAVASLTGCEAMRINDPGVVCTAIAVSSLNVTVRDAATASRVCDASVVAIQGGVVTHALERMGECVYAGPWELAGDFEVVVTRAGYETVRVPGIRVGRDECHVIPVSLTVDLRPRS